MVNCRGARYKYYVNLVVATLGIVNVILGMDFLKVYNADISLKVETVTFSAGTMINTLMEEEGPDRVSVHLGQDCALLAGHLNQCHTRAGGWKAQGNLPLRAYARTR